MWSVCSVYLKNVFSGDLIVMLIMLPLPFFVQGAKNINIIAICWILEVKMFCFFGMCANVFYSQIKERKNNKRLLIFSFLQNVQLNWLRDSAIQLCSWPNLLRWQMLFVWQSCFAEEAVLLSLWNLHQKSRGSNFHWTNSCFMHKEIFVNTYALYVKKDTFQKAFIEKLTRN